MKKEMKDSDLRKMLLALVAMLFAIGLNADIKVSDVEVFSGYPWKEVVIGYTITGTDSNADAVLLTATDKSANKSYTARTLTEAKLSEGRHMLRWNAAAEGAKFSSGNVVFTVSVMELGGVQLWENGPYWAECNVGATKPEEYGYYYWWGDTVGYKRVGSRWNAVDGSKTGFSFEKRNCPIYEMDDVTLMSEGCIDATGNLAAKYDVATAHLGAPWRMPTSAEWEALISKCTTIWTTRNGVYGLLVTGKDSYASRSVFFPAAGYGWFSDYLDGIGYYWSSTPLMDGVALFFELSKTGHNRVSNWTRNIGMPVRPLRGFAK